MHEVTVEVRAQYTMLENDEAGTACRTFDDEDENEFDCRSRCRMEMIRVATAQLSRPEYPRLANVQVHSANISLPQQRRPVGDFPDLRL